MQNENEKKTHAQLEKWEEFPGDMTGLEQCLRTYFENERMEYDYWDGEGMFITSITLEGGKYTIDIVFSVYNGCVVVNSLWPRDIPKNRRQEVMEYIVKVNLDHFGGGCFQFEAESGRISYRSNISVYGLDRITTGQIHGAFLDTVGAFLIYGEGIDGVANHGESPECMLADAREKKARFN